jgi:tRNA (guanine37-N1)-methyltransferase
VSPIEYNSFVKIDILTLFPEMFRGPFDESIIKRARDKGLIKINIHQLRDWATDKHKTVDDRPFGGGVGMVLKVEPVFKALQALNPNFEFLISKKTPKSNVPKIKTLLLTPQGKRFDQEKARELSKLKHIILVCGRYEGFDERIREHLVDEEISIGDYVMTGGELPAMVVTETVARLVPGVLEKGEATAKESFSDGNNIEYPQYTRPEDFNGWRVPEILLSGNHAQIEKWRVEESRLKTKKGG